jgi:hypothetical protein
MVYKVHIAQKQTCLLEREEEKHQGQVQKHFSLSFDTDTHSFFPFLDTHRTVFCMTVS